MHAGRAAAVRQSHDWREVDGRWSRRLYARCRCWPTAAVAWMRRLVECCWPSAIERRSTLRRAVARGAARCRREFSWWWRRRRPPLWRVSGDVVTAGLISSRVWFGPVPGSP
ncbi:plant synaptotagmin [Dorcoceras hygrometricum]|uniref:Plant synaptotagmin n=1 Tax=Dorcoceras hygrometricum TaxID=472368 RepID=A0A2Z6ZVY6_9LAMI|nr:plant synaptotagmin [Dorcoceras hygrometricum]